MAPEGRETDSREDTGIKKQKPTPPSQGEWASEFYCAGELFGRGRGSSSKVWMPLERGICVCAGYTTGIVPDDPGFI